MRCWYYCSKTNKLLWYCISPVCDQHHCFFIPLLLYPHFSSSVSAIQAASVGGPCSPWRVLGSTRTTLTWRSAGRSAEWTEKRRRRANCTAGLPSTMVIKKHSTAFPHTGPHTGPHTVQTKTFDEGSTSETIWYFYTFVCLHVFFSHENMWLLNYRLLQLLERLGTQSAQPLVCDIFGSHKWAKQVLSKATNKFCQSWVKSVTTTL